MIENKANLDYIDSLRGIAILMVIMVHVTVNTFGVGNALDLLGRYGQMGVQLFFLVSAITLCMSLERTINQKNWLSSFYIKRYFRIAPLYYVGIVIYFAYRYCLYLSFRHNPFFVGLFNNYTPINVFANVFFIHGFYEPANNTVVAGGWSIGTEMAFYVLFPVLFIAMLNLFKLFKKRGLLLLLIYISIILINIYAVYMIGKTFHFKLENNSFLYFNLLNQFPVFLTGMFLYFTLKSFNFNIRNYIIIVLLVITTALAIICFRSFNNITLIPLTSCFSFTALFFAFKNIKSINTKFLKRVGQLSFSIYIFHFLLAEIVSKTVSKHVFKGNHAYFSVILSYVIVLSLSFAIATLSEKFIEKKGIGLGRRLISTGQGLQLLSFRAKNLRKNLPDNRNSALTEISNHECTKL